MICPKCNAAIAENTKFCPSCGAPIQVQAAQPQYQQYQQQYQQPPQKKRAVAENVDFIGAVKRLFTYFVEYEGRATRSEYWWAYLFNFLCGMTICLIPVIGWIGSIGLSIAMVCCSIRRLHDAGYSGYYYLMFLIPIAGPIILIVYLAKPSVPDNQWGPAAPGTVFQQYPNNGYQAQAQYPNNGYQAQAQYPNNGYQSNGAYQQAPVQTQNVQAPQNQNPDNQA